MDSPCEIYTKTDLLSSANKVLRNLRRQNSSFGGSFCLILLACGMGPIMSSVALGSPIEVQCICVSQE